jgi:hypothetical protein
MKYLTRFFAFSNLLKINELPKIRKKRAGKY